MTGPAHPLPPWLEPVLAFLNTIDVEEGTDALAGGTAALASWLAGQGLLTEPAILRPGDHRRALDLREGLRAHALANNGGPADHVAIGRLRSLLADLPLVVDPTLPGEPAPAEAPPLLRPHGRPPGVVALGRLAAGYALALATGRWQRLRRCPAEDCGWVFWDSSAKGTRRWCTMRVCGNRAKARAFAQRHAG